MQKVADRRREYMTWPAEIRLRAAAWYAYRVKFRNMDVEYQLWAQVLRQQIMHNTGKSPEPVGDAEWV